MSNVRDPDVDHVIWTSVSVRALNPKDKVEAFYFGAYACCWEKPVDRRGLAAAFQGVAKTNIFAEYSVRTHIHTLKRSIQLIIYFHRLRLLRSKHVHLVIAYLSKQAVVLLHMVTFLQPLFSHRPILIG